MIMNKEQQQINKATKKAMRKLVAFSLTDLFDEKTYLCVQFYGRQLGILCYIHKKNDCEIMTMPMRPKSVTEIESFERAIERAMANVKRELLEDKGE